VHFYIFSKLFFCVCCVSVLVASLFLVISVLVSRFYPSWFHGGWFRDRVSTLVNCMVWSVCRCQSACLDYLGYRKNPAFHRGSLFSKTEKRRTLKGKYFWNLFLEKLLFRNVPPTPPQESQPAQNWKIFLEKNAKKRMSHQPELCCFGFLGGCGGRGFYRQR
jgi:hypothetical protein